LKIASGTLRLGFWYVGFGLQNDVARLHGGKPFHVFRQVATKDVDSEQAHLN